MGQVVVFDTHCEPFQYCPEGHVGVEETHCAPSQYWPEGHVGVDETQEEPFQYCPEGHVGVPPPLHCSGGSGGQIGGDVCVAITGPAKSTT